MIKKICSFIWSDALPILSCTSVLLLLFHASLLTPMCSPPGACLRRCWPWRSTATCRTWRTWWSSCCGTWCSRAAALSPNCCCDAPSPSWRSCSPTGCPSASMASSGSAALASHQCYVCFLGRVIVAEEEFLFFWLFAGNCRPALVLDGERSHAADSEGAGGLCDGESPVYTQRGLAAVAGSGLQLLGTNTFILHKHQLYNQKGSLSLKKWKNCICARVQSLELKNNS